MTTHRVPDLGLCPVCEAEVRLRKTGLVFKHDAPDSNTCPGTGSKAAARLEPTFRRWLARLPRRGCAWHNGQTVVYLAEEIDHYGIEHAAHGRPWQTLAELTDLVEVIADDGGPDVRGDLDFLGRLYAQSLLETA